MDTAGRLQGPQANSLPLTIAKRAARSSGAALASALAWLSVCAQLRTFPGVSSIQPLRKRRSWGNWGVMISLATPGDRRKVRLMRIKGVVTLAAIVVLSRWSAGAQIYDTNNDVVQTFAGSGFSGYVDGVGQQTMFNNPSQIVADSHSNLFVLDLGNQRIRKITPDGIVSTFAGGGVASAGIGTNVALSFGTLSGMVIDHNDTIWLACYAYESPLKLYHISNNATVAFANLPIYYNAHGICVDSLGNVYLSDDGNNQIDRYNTNGVLEVFAGSGNTGSSDGNGIFTSFNFPLTLAADTADNIYVWDAGNYLIRRINQNRDVTTIAGHYFGNGNADGVGTNAAFGLYGIYGMCFDSSGNLLLASGNCIREISPTTNVVTLAGGFSGVGYANGVGNLAQFNGASGVCVSHGTIYVADTSNQRIRSITNNSSAQVVSGANLGIGTFTGVTITGMVGRTYQLQSSPDMASWTTRATLLLDSSPYLWIDQTPVSGKKFYRAFLLP